MTGRPILYIITCVHLHKLDELLEDLRRHELEDVLHQLEQHREEELGSEGPQQREHHVDLGQCNRGSWVQKINQFVWFFSQFSNINYVQGDYKLFEPWGRGLSPSSSSVICYQFSKFKRWSCLKFSVLFSHLLPGIQSFTKRHVHFLIWPHSVASSATCQKTSNRQLTEGSASILETQDKPYSKALYRVIQLHLTPEIEVFHMHFERSRTKNGMRYIKQHIKCYNFLSNSTGPPCTLKVTNPVIFLSFLPCPCFWRWPPPRSCAWWSRPSWPWRARARRPSWGSSARPWRWGRPATRRTAPTERTPSPRESSCGWYSDTVV